MAHVICVALLAVLSALLSDPAQARSHILLRGGKHQRHKQVQNIDAPAEDLDLMNQVAGKMNYNMNPEEEDPEAVYEATESGEELKAEVASHEVDTPTDVLSALGSSYEAVQKTKDEATKEVATAEPRPEVTPMKITDAVVRAAAENMNQVATAAAPTVAEHSVVAAANDAEQVTTIDAAGLSDEQDVTDAHSNKAGKNLEHKLPVIDHGKQVPAVLVAASQIIEQGHAAKKKIASFVKQSGKVQHKAVADDVDDEEESGEKEAASDTEQVAEVESESTSDESGDADAGSEATEVEENEASEADAASSESAEMTESETEETSNAQETTSDASQSGAEQETDAAVSGGSVDAEDEAASAQETN